MIEFFKSEIWTFEEADFVILFLPPLCTSILTLALSKNLAKSYVCSGRTTVSLEPTTSKVGVFIFFGAENPGFKIL